jgi:hypothetical protein
LAPCSLNPSSSRPAEPASPAPRPLRAGMWVQITEGVAAGAKGWVCACAAGKATIMAIGITRLPLLLTVPVQCCRPAPAGS